MVEIFRLTVNRSMQAHAIVLLVAINQYGANTMRKPNGFVFYRGFSPIDQAPIVGIAVFESSNVKTGNMVQTYIIRSDVNPISAVNTGDDKSICGNCVHRGNEMQKRTCYVDYSKSVNAVFKAFERGSYPDFSHNVKFAALWLKGRKIRLGAYGDPAMIPAENWLELLELASDWTGYTHQWREPFAQAHRELCMASADSISDRDVARAMGWRTFRVIPIGSALKLQNEAICPASPEGGDKKQCITCGACDGALKPSAASIAIVVHGKSAKQFAEV
jgi:hypothetical protein